MMTPGETITTKQGEEFRIIQVRELDLICVLLDEDGVSTSTIKPVLKRDVIWIQTTMF